MELQREDAVSIKEFVSALLNAAGIAAEHHDKIGYGYGRGWLQEQDVTGSRLPLIKKNCARIVHEFLRCEQKESDELDSGPAGKLQDLFDCRVCAGHVMQVYSKGIMDGRRNEKERYIFGMEDIVSHSMAVEIIKRTLQQEQRVERWSEPDVRRQAKRVSVAEAQSMLGQEKDAILIDVRNESEYQDSHLKNAMHCPMMEILKNPYMVSERRDVLLFLYCSKGYMSEAAAQALVHAGYEKVMYFALESERGDESN